MRKTVDEKLHETLEKRLGESFKMVSERLEQVHKGLGEMQSLAVGVGDLKKVLSNVKTRGILGEYQLGNILEQIMSPGQYDTNVATKKGSQANVEYAVKLPGKVDEKVVWLPIDSKFPLESYQRLMQALEVGDVEGIHLAEKELLKAIESFAKDISTKYIDPPNTTDFAILFLPIEGLYAEVLRHPEVFEKLQRVYHITITGPTTLSALLNSLHMGFRTLAVQKRSSEVWNVLAEVKTEFVKYADQLEKVQKHLNTASNSLESLQTTRTSVMERKLRGVEALEADNDEPVALIEK
ncbi:MAG: DNA recombination protein RmuC [Methyloprofundus sp.]|nr:DNA recombination protein RmuC [Methyloprofundus sp.]